MLKTFRRHQRHCSHRTKGRAYRACRCVIWCDGFLSGRRVRASLDTRDWQRAQLIVRDWEAEGRVVVDESQPELVTIGDACEKFLADAKARGLRSASVYKYDLLFRQMRAFTDNAGLRYIEQLDLDALRRFRESWPNKNIAGKKKLEALRTFFGFCRDSGWISSNPAELVKLPKVERPPVLPFTDEEVERIRAACDQYPLKGKADRQRLRALVELLLCSGLRIGDAVTLRRDAVVGNEIHMRTAKTGAVIRCPLSPPALELLRMVRGPSNAHFFWSGESKPKSCVGNWQRALKKLFKLAKVQRGHAHRFRHTFAKMLLMGGIHIDRVSALLGHQNVAVTMRHYAQWVPERQKQAEADVKRVWAQLYGTPLAHEPQATRVN